MKKGELCIWLMLIKRTSMNDLIIHLRSKLREEEGLIYAPIDTTEDHFSLAQVGQ